MDNPNNSSGQLRRHNSVPSKYQLGYSNVASQLRLKSNPYIGSFRHSPPTSFLSIMVSSSDELQFKDAIFPFKMSPYAGFFRNQYNSDFGAKTLGGDSSCVDSASFETKLIESKLCEQGTGYNTAKILRKLSAWLTLPFNFNLTLAEDGQKVVPDDPVDGRDDSSSTIDDDGRGYYSDDLSLSTLATCDDEVWNHDRSLDASLSHVAEAYYAHQAKQEVDEFSSNEQHLDFCVSQFDIARMARNASKHLDVESILSLPTLTYRCSSSKECRDGDEINESWSLVTAPNMDQFTEEVTRETNICVICRDEYVEGDRLRVLPCNHNFHMHCIDLSDFSAIVTSGCPLCKRNPVANNEGIEFDGSVPSWAFAQLGGALARSLGV